MSQEIFVDELDGVLVGYPMSKLRFVSFRGSDDDGQPISEQVLMLTIPTNELISMANYIIKNAENDASALSKMSVSATSEFQKMIQQIEKPVTKKSISKSK